jgi:hypothetical protein
MSQVRLNAAAAALLVACASASAGSDVGTRVDVLGAANADIRGTLSGETDVYRFDAAEGAKLGVRLVATPRKSLRFAVRLVAPGGDDIELPGSRGYVNRRGLMTIRDRYLSGSGQYTLTVAGTGTGDYRLKWTTDPGAAPRSVDLRCTSLGRAPGEETAVCRVTTASETTSIAVASLSDLAGSRLIVPADAAAPGTPVLLASGAVPPVPERATRHAAGPAAEVSPGGIVLGSPALLTLAYDPHLVPRDANAAADLAVARTDADGAPVSLQAVSVDTQAHTVTVRTDRFGRFVVTSPTGPLDPSGRTYWRGTFDVAYTTDTNGDSRRRDVVVRVGRAAFAADGTVAGRGLQYDAMWTHEDSGRCSAVIHGYPDRPSSSTWKFAADGRRIEIAGADGAFEISENGQALVGQTGTRADPTSCRFDAALLRADRAPTAASLAGTFTVGMSELGMSWGSARPLGLDAGVSAGTAVLRSDGTWSITVDEQTTRFANRPRRLVPAKFHGTLRGRWTVVGAEDPWAEGSLRLSIPTPAGAIVFHAYPSADGNAWFAVSDAADPSYFMFFVAVRRAKSLSPESLTGEWSTSGLAFAMTTYGVPPDGSPQRTVPDLNLVQSDARFACDGTPALSMSSGSLTTVRRNPASPGGVAGGTWPDAATGEVISFSMAPNGTLSIPPVQSGRRGGAFSADANVGFLVTTPFSLTGEYGLRLLVRSPPAK